MFAIDFYNSISIENRYFAKACSNYARIILKNNEKHKFVWLNVIQPDFLELNEC